MKPVETILEELIELTQSYAKVFRYSVDPARAHLVDEDTDFLDEQVRESLMSHVWHAPILAIHLHPYLETTVDLGHTLKLLALHDLGELEVGDVMSTNQNPENEAREREAARKRLSEEHFFWYCEFQDAETNEWKFALSVDKICPDIATLAAQNGYEKDRMAFHGHVISDFYEKKWPVMQWDPFLRSFYQHLMMEGEKKFW